MVLVRDLLIWFTAHMLCVYLCHKAPDTWYRRARWPFLPFLWEEQGRVYNRLLKVGRWKDLIPDGGRINSYGFQKGRVQSLKREYLQRFILETKRSEMIHLTGILSLGLFFLVHPFLEALLISLVFLLLDVPCIIIQRYNRPRLHQLLIRQEASR